MFVIWLIHERDGAMEYYTINDIQILTGYSRKKIRLIIKKLNEKIIKKYNYVKLKPLLFNDKIEKNIYLKEWRLNYDRNVKK